MPHYIWQNSDWPLLRWNGDVLLKPLGKSRLEQGKLLSRMAELGMRLSQETQCEILTEETLQTAAIEGEMYDRDAIRSSVARRLGLPIVGMNRVDRYADGLVEVLLDATQNFAKPLTIERLHGWHACLFPTGFSGLHRIVTGNWRGDAPMRVVSGPIGREIVHYEAPPSERIPREMNSFFHWWEESHGSMDGVLRAGIAHFWFVTLHPYEDGNGRLARAITDMALAQDEQQPIRFYSLSAQIMLLREEYYSVLERSQRGSLDITEWLVWFLSVFSGAISRSYSLLDATFKKARFWQEHASQEINQRQRKAINKLLDAEPDGFKGGLTTKKYVSIAKTSRATAYREIMDLVQKGLLQPNPGRGRNVSYSLMSQE